MNKDQSLYILLIVITLVVCSIAYFVFYLKAPFQLNSVNNTDIKVGTGEKKIVSKVESMREATNNYIYGKDISDTYDNLKMRDDLTKVEISKLAVLAGGAYRTSGEESYLKEYIDRLKKVVLDPEQSKLEKAKRLNELATLFCGLGRDTDTLSEIFKGEPFSKYWVEGDGALSAKKLLEWSYSEFGKRPMSAIFLSRWYVNRTLVRDLDAKTKKENLKMARKYLTEADELVKEEVLRYKYFTDTYEYNIYEFWKTFIIVGMHKIDPNSITDNELKEHNFTKYGEKQRLKIKQSGISNSTYFPYSILMVANVLDAYFAYNENNDKFEANQKLIETMNLIKKDQNLKTNTYIEFMSDSVNAGPESGIVVKATQAMRKINVNFDVFMTKVIADHVKNKQATN